LYSIFNHFNQILQFFACLALAVFLFVPHVFAQSEEELSLLRLYYRDKDLVFTPTRNLQPVSRTAENVTIITAEEIERMNAHTLADVLNTVPGVQVQIRGGPGSAADIAIQGSEPRHVLVLIDGIKLNNLAENFPDAGSIPVQMIERIEVLKGPGSSTWGSSLGGVVNIITKSPDGARPFGGSVSASAGERRTGDYRAETTGTADRLAYYIYGGYLTSGGFAPQTSVYTKNLYSKFMWSLPKASVTWTGGYVGSSRGLGAAPEFDLSLSTKNMFSALTFNTGPTDDLDIYASIRAIKTYQRYTTTIGQFSDSLPYGDQTLGGSAKISYRHGFHNLVVGSDFDDGRTEGSWLNGRHTLRTLAFFANDAMTIRNLSVIPGIRYDHTNTNGGFVSPSLGIAYKISESTTLRAYGAIGFNVPTLSSMYSATVVPNPDLRVEKVKSLHIGLESFALKYLWFKTTLFRHDISDPISGIYHGETDTRTIVNGDRQRRQGVEVEVKTKPFYHFSLGAGTAYIDPRNRETGERLPDSTRYTYDVSLEYNNDKLFFALLKGHYTRIRTSDPQAKDSAFVWDIHASKEVAKSANTSAQIFFSVRNLFNADQYTLSLYPNPSRWIEAGVRVKF
jgi:vitamin B12 transporter